MMAEIPNIGRETLTAPYASTGHVLNVLRRYRDRSLPPELTPDNRSDLGIGKQDAYRALAALEFLGFLDDHNHPQPIFHTLRTLTDEEYRSLLAERVRAAYSALFQILDPATDPQQRIRDHFRRYDPASQTARQYALFMALCSEAGLIDGRQRQQPPAAQVRGSQQPRNRQEPARRTPPRVEVPPPVPSTVESVRIRLMEALVQKVTEIDPTETDKVQWYLEKIKEVESGTEREVAEDQD